MGAKEVEKRGSQSAPSSKGGKMSSPKDQVVPHQAGAPSTVATQEGKGSNSKDKIPPSQGGASNAKATKSPRTVEGHVPNAETAKVLREAREGKNLLHYESVEEMFKDLGI
jgi:hypothetical protein